MKEQINVTGSVRMVATKNGEIVLDETFSNLVVTQGRERFAKLLAGETVDPVTKFSIGVGTTAPSASDTDLQDEVTISSGVTAKAIDDATFPVAGQVKFAFMLTETEGNGNDLSEFALRADDGVMISRVTRTPYPKDNTSVLNFYWTIKF